MHIHAKLQKHTVIKFGSRMYITSACHIKLFCVCAVLLMSVGHNNASTESIKQQLYQVHESVRELQNAVPKKRPQKRPPQTFVKKMAARYQQLVDWLGGKQLTKEQQEQQQKQDFLRAFKQEFSSQRGRDPSYAQEQRALEIWKSSHYEKGIENAAEAVYQELTQKEQQEKPQEQEKASALQRFEDAFKQAYQATFGYQPGPGDIVQARNIRDEIKRDVGVQEASAENVLTVLLREQGGSDREQVMKDIFGDDYEPEEDG